MYSLAVLDGVPALARLPSWLAVLTLVGCAVRQPDTAAICVPVIVELTSPVAHKPAVAEIARRTGVPLTAGSAISALSVAVAVGPLSSGMTCDSAMTRLRADRAIRSISADVRRRAQPAARPE